jgi:hypothetical protein
MQPPRQLRVRLQLGRLASLERKYRLGILTADEAREIFQLRELEARRRSYRAWYARDDNAERRAEYGRQWRQANPGCF